MKLSKIKPLFDTFSPHLFFLCSADISALRDQRPDQDFYPWNLEAVIRSNLIYGCKDQVRFSYGIIKTRSIRERNERQRGCLNITVMNDKSTLSQFIPHFSLYLAMSSVFAFKEYSVSKIQVFQPFPLFMCQKLQMELKWSKVLYNQRANSSPALTLLPFSEPSRTCSVFTA